MKIEVRKNTKGMINNGYKCKMCKVTYETQFECKEHMRNEHDALGFTCDKQFNKLLTLMTHKIT